MKTYKLTSVIFLISTLFCFVSCHDNSTSEVPTVEFKTKSQKLAEEVFKNGDFISPETAPKIISAEEVYNSLDKNNLILDLRRAKDFADGHIKGAVNLKLKELIDFAQVKGFPMYEKVVLVCYTGQSASYSNAVLRLLGHSNVYAMKWGMCGWNKKFSNRWESHVSDIGLSKLRSKKYEKNNSVYTLPIIECRKNTGPEILYLRSRAILDEGFGKASVKLNYLEAYAKDCYVVSYQAENIYKKNHLKNAVYYGYESSLNLSTDLLSLPSEKTIVVYSNDGHSSAYLAAYLKLLGYDAKTLKYGASSFMISKMLDFGAGFKDTMIKNYPFETSVYIEDEEEVQEGGC